MDNNRILITLTGASSSGKTFLSELFNNHNIKTLVSDTTRLIRSGEVDGVNYNFLTPEQFQKNLDENKMLQFNPVGQYMYGVSFDEVQKTFDMGKDGVVVVAPLGVPQIAKFCEKNNINHLAIYIDNPKDILMDRIIDRFTLDLWHKFKPKDTPPTIFINSHKDTVKEYFLLLNYQLLAKHHDDFKSNLNEFGNLIINEAFDGYPKEEHLTIKDSVVKTYYDRIYQMATSEFETWVLPAYTGDDKYHLIVTKFDPKTQEEVVNKILEKASFLKENKAEFFTEILPFSNHYEQYLKTSGKTLTPHAIKTNVLKP